MTFCLENKSLYVSQNGANICISLNYNPLLENDVFLAQQQRICTENALKQDN